MPVVCSIEMNCDKCGDFIEVGVTNYTNNTFGILQRSIDEAIDAGWYIEETRYGYGNIYCPDCHANIEAPVDESNEQ